MVDPTHRQGPENGLRAAKFVVIGSRWPAFTIVIFYSPTLKVVFEMNVNQKHDNGYFPN